MTISIGVQLSREKQKTKRLSKRERSYFDEMGERGKELEKIRALVEGWRDQLPEVFLGGFQEIFNGYKKRCGR